MESESEIHPHSPHPNTHVNLHLQHSCGLLTLIPSVRQDQTPPIGAPETKKKNRRVLRTARQRRLQRIKISTRLYHRKLKAQIAYLTRENERLKEIEDLRLAAGLKVQLKRSLSSHF
ncbi:uncharacterized protein LOC123192183 [Mangifera indica]|uniref:uncharacterized protein LOC123192183 n=1 Tax=Mangifera indica TaxID=29780 RepID=UPI001CFB90AF|nr:uncharacterized protein LOC123192183 [Mangifera indica]